MVIQINQLNKLYPRVSYKPDIACFTSVNMITVKIMRGIILIKILGSHSSAGVWFQTIKWPKNRVFLMANKYMDLREEVLLWNDLLYASTFPTMLMCVRIFASEVRIYDHQFRLTCVLHWVQGLESDMWSNSSRHACKSKGKSFSTWILPPGKCTLCIEQYSPNPQNMSDKFRKGF